MTPALRWREPDPEVTQSTDDTALLARLRAEPGGIIGDVVGRFERPLLKYARALLRSDAAAQDVVQEAFVRLLHKVSSVRSLSAWLGRVTHNLAVDHLRREARMRKLHVAAVAEQGPAVVVADHDPTRREVAEALERGLQALSVNERAVIVLKVVDGKSYKEISAITGLSPSNVGYLIHHGLKKMAAQLEAAGAFRGGVR
jgi:RNA polymerase sigma-70 factor (ECF subfamily)